MDIWNFKHTFYSTEILAHIYIPQKVHTEYHSHNKKELSCVLYTFSDLYFFIQDPTGSQLGFRFLLKLLLC